MKRIAILVLLAALLLAPAVARAEAGTEAWETAYDIFMNRINDEIGRTGEPDRMYDGAEVIMEDYQVFSCSKDGTFAIVRPNDDFSAVSEIELFVEDVSAFRRRLDDVAVLAYCFGSRDSVEAVTDWCDRWCDALASAAEEERDLETDTCECPALEASMRVYQNDAEIYWLRISIDVYS